MRHLQQAVRSDPDNTTVRAYYRKIKVCRPSLWYTAAYSFNIDLQFLQEIDERKSAGDELFKAADHAGAVEAYAQCIAVTKDNRPFSAKLHLNRATSLLKLKRYEDAVKDCNMAIYYNDRYVKAYVRRAEAQVAMNTPEAIQKGIEWVDVYYCLLSLPLSLICALN